MTFSERYNIVARRLKLQRDGMGRDLRIALWNAFCLAYYDRDARIGVYPWVRALTLSIYSRFFKRSAVDLPSYTRKVREEMRVFFLKQEWYRVYDFVEFVFSIRHDREGNELQRLNEAAEVFSRECNAALELHLSAYRMVQGRIEDIGGQVEEQIIKDIVANSEDRFGMARRDFWASYEYILRQDHPDKREAVGVCLKALDEVARVLLDDSEARLSDVIDFADLDSRMILALKTFFNCRREGDRFIHVLTEKEDLSYREMRLFMSMAAVLSTFLMTAEPSRFEEIKKNRKRHRSISAIPPVSKDVAQQEDDLSVVSGSGESVVTPSTPSTPLERRPPVGSGTDDFSRRLRLLNETLTAARSDSSKTVDPLPTPAVPRVQEGGSAVRVDRASLDRLTRQLRGHIEALDQDVEPAGISDDAAAAVRFALGQSVHESSHSRDSEDGGETVAPKESADLESQDEPSDDQKISSHSAKRPTDVSSASPEEISAN